jgi:hypothetical protein
MSKCPSCRAACILLARGAFASGLKNSQLYSESALPAITGKRDKIMSDKKTMSHGNIYCTAIKMKSSSIVSRMSLYEFLGKKTLFFIIVQLCPTDGMDFILIPSRLLFYSAANKLHSSTYITYITSIPSRTGRLSLQEHILTHHTRQPLVC